MKKLRLIFLSSAAWLAAVTFVQADPPRACPSGHAVFGRVSCSSAEDSATLLDAYFFGATSLEEVGLRFPERLERFRARCQRKIFAREIASETSSGAAIETLAVKLRISTVESCSGRRGYQEPCTQNADCIENFCHPDRGTCSAVFTVPMTAAH